MTWRRPTWALYALVVGLAVHNLAMSLLWRAGVRGTALTVIAAWKDVLLLVALALVVVARRGLPFKGSATDWLALAFGALVVLYALLPQSWLGGLATHKGVLYALRHDLLPVEAYFLGRGLDLTEGERARVCKTVLATAAFVALYGSQTGIDVAADAMAYAWQNWARVGAMADPAAYLFRVGQSASRRYRRRHLVFPAVAPADRDVVALDLPDALATLSPRQRGAVVLVHAHGYTLAAAASLMGISVSSLRNHLERGMRRLRRVLGEESE